METVFCFFNKLKKVYALSEFGNKHQLICTCLIRIDNTMATSCNSSTHEVFINNADDNLRDREKAGIAIVGPMFCHGYLNLDILMFILKVNRKR